ncbi:hypothetical protein [Mariniblastus fucicola]|uniref:Zinc ribbon domain-containing protein n=1 Tax=Mariniblastus fucicola TaxID=980251 RepID=A0A5B9P1U6_9BACT|nr:hypothetical protein [Mariniblastus fucicola]QEG20224.1 hypothetical protein MFFC18_00710 [Mariniblastus fucicola]
MSNPIDPVADVVVATMLCPVCEADLSPDAAVCFQCGCVSVDPNVNPFALPAERPAKAPKGIENETKFTSSLISMLLTGGLVGVLVAVGLASPGLAILLALMAIPPWIRTTLVVFKRSKTGLATDNFARATLFFGSAMVSWLVLAVSLVSCFLTFCAVCWVTLINGPERMNDSSTQYLLYGTLGVTFLVILGIFSPWILYRWKRDTTRER